MQPQLERDNIAPTLPGSIRTPLIGREEERRRLRQALEKAVRGEGALVLISGEAGVGKTRVAEELATEASELGALSLTGHCYESEEAPYVPFVEILQSGLRGTTQEAFREGLGKYAADVAKLMPELRRLFTDIPPPLELPPEQERRYLFNSLCELLEQASRLQPLLLTLEDLHWADSSTLMLLQHIVRRLQNMSVLLMCTYRDTEIDWSDPFKATLAEIVRRRSADRIALKRLSPPHVKAIFEALGGEGAPEPVANAVYSETEGNPFFVEEVFKYLTEEGKLFDAEGRWLTGLQLSEGDVPESIRLVLGRRLRRLAEQCLDMLVQAAIIGRDFNADLLLDLSGGDRNSLLATLEEAEQSHLITPLREPRGSFAFAHELVRQTILSDLSRRRREALHLRAAQAIEARYVSPKADDRQTLEEFASRLAYHYYQAGTEADSRKTVDYLTIAGERAMSAAAFEDALLHFDRAVSLIPPDDASRAAPLFGRGLARRSLGQWEGALADWREALSSYEGVNDADAVGRVAWSMTIQLLWGGRYLEALEISRRGLIGLGERVNADRCMLLGAAGVTLSFGGYYPSGQGMIAQALAMAESMGDERLLGRALTFASVHHLSWMEYPQAIETGLRSAGMLRPRGDLWFLADALWSVQDAELGMGELKKVARLGEELEGFGSRLGHQAATLFAGSNRALHELMLHGGIDAFEEFARNDLKLRRKLGFPWVSQCYTWMGLCEFWRGRWEEALRHFDESLEVDDPAFFTGSAWASVFMAKAYTGRRDEAHQLLEKYRSSLPKTGQPNTASAWTMLPSVVEGLIVLGERNQGADLYPVVLDAIRTGTLLPWDIGQLLQLTAGMAAATARDWESSEEHYQAALRQAEDIPIVIQQPEVRRWYAKMLLERRHRGDRRRALELISQAIEGYRRIGMPRHVELAQTLGGGRAGDQQRYPDGLTEREVEILRLVAEGRTSREIGDELVLSMRTVERHITNIYSKINAHTRAQATAYALARGLWTPSA